MVEQYKTIAVKLPFLPSYRYAVGKSVTKFLDELKNKKVIGIKCPKCGRVYVPPRNICGRCIQDLSEFIEVATTGIIENLTTAYITITISGEMQDLKEPKIYGLVKLDGATSSIYGEILNKDVKIGDKVEIVWNETLKGDWKDIVGFRIKN